jgi:glycosyltransferase involved in cell wall biosynthesis
MKTIAYITERELNSTRINGSVTRDIKLLKILNKSGDVTVYYSDVTKFSKYEFLFKNKHCSPVINEINMKQYDIVIISTFLTSPYLRGYRNIIHSKIFYLCDSGFHMMKNVSILKIKYKLIFFFLTLIEKNIIKHEKCAYLGNDEVNSLPKKHRKNAVIFPFYIEPNSVNAYHENGYIFYVGDYDFWSNKEALQKILLMAKNISCTIKIFGSNIPALKNVPENVELVGYAKSLDEIYTGAKALIYPVSYGTGIKNKIIEAMSYGIPVVGLKNAFTNLNVTDKQNAIIVKKTDEMVWILNNVNLNEISNQTYSFVKNNMSEKIVTEQIEKYIL